MFKDSSSSFDNLEKNFVVSTNENGEELYIRVCFDFCSFFTSFGSHPKSIHYQK